MALSPAQRTAVTRRYQQRLGVLAERSVASIDRLWVGLTGYRDADLAAFAKASAPAAATAKAAAVNVATGYFAAILATAPPALKAADVPVTFNAQSGFLAVRKALADGYDLERAATVGRSQAQAAARNLTISTARTTGDVFAERANVRITGWVRNAEANSCPWCAGLDGVVFLTAEAGDFGHDRCNCTVSPLVA